MSEGGGGLRWWGVGSRAGTSSDTLLKKSKRLRQSEAMRGQKVGSAPIQTADDWLATAAANRAFRERDGATGNPFLSAEALVKESQRQRRGKTGIEWSLASTPTTAALTVERAPGLYWDDAKDFAWPTTDDTDIATDVLAHLSSFGDDDDDEKKNVAADDEDFFFSKNDDADNRQEKSVLSREELRDIEVSVLELREELEEKTDDDDDVEMQCDALRQKLIAIRLKKKQTEPKAPPTKPPRRRSPSPVAFQEDLRRREDLRRQEGVVVDFDDDLLEGETTKPPPEPAAGVTVDFDDDDSSAGRGDTATTIEQKKHPPPGVVVDFDDDDDL